MRTVTSYPALPRKRNRKIFLIIVFSILFIAVAGLLYWNLNKKRIIREKLETMITEKSGGMYQVNYDNMELDEIKGNLMMQNLRIGYDSAKWAAITDEDQKPSVLVNMLIPDLAITGVKTRKALAGKEIVGKNLLIQKPVIRLYYTNAGSSASRSIPGRDVYKQILGELELIRLDSVIIRDARIISYNLQSKRDSIVMENANIVLGQVAVDSLSQLDTTRIMFARTFHFDAQKIDWSARSGSYDYAIHQLEMNSNNNTMSIQKIEIVPLLGEKEFVQRSKYQTDRLDINLSGIKASGVDFTRVLDEKLIADKMELGHVSMKIYRDLRKPRENKELNDCYPHHFIKKVPVPFIIEQVSVPGMRVEYKEVSDLTGRESIIRFADCRATISNVSNVPEWIRENGTCRIDLTSNLLELTPLQVNLQFPLSSSNGSFSVRGTTGSLDARSLNKITEPSGMARIRSGQVKKLSFDLRGNEAHAAGTVTILYNDLKVDILEFDDDKPGGIDKKDVTSFLGNLMIRNDNPKDGETRVATVDHQRDRTRSFYNLVWKTIFEGINQTIGIKKPMKRP